MPVKLPPSIENLWHDFIVDVGYSDYARSEERLRRTIAAELKLGQANLIREIMNVAAPTPDSWRSLFAIIEGIEARLRKEAHDLTHVIEQEESDRRGA